MPPRKSILIVEDDEDLRRMFRHALSVAGYDVKDTGDGINALRLVELQRPDLLILDLGLPLPSGLNVQQEIAAPAHTRAIPALIVTPPSPPPPAPDAACLLN